MEHPVGVTVVSDTHTHTHRNSYTLEQLPYTFYCTAFSSCPACCHISCIFIH